MRTMVIPVRTGTLALVAVMTACSTESGDALPGVGGSTTSSGGAGAATASGGAGAATASGGAGSSGAAGSSLSGAAGSGALASGGSAGMTAGGAGAGEGGRAGMSPVSGGNGGAPAGNGGRPGSGGRAGGATGGAASTAGRAGGAGAGGTSLDPGDHSAPGTCARWNADRADMSEGTWDGDVASCAAGMISTNAHDNALRLYNLYRWLADLPAVTTDPERDSKAQACALLMTANDDLSHDPPMDWTCWTQAAHDGASSSNISSGPGVSSVDLYMVDGGNEDTLGHRRWILSNSLGPIGLGSTGPMGSSCMQNLNGTGKAGKTWLAWPPPGPFPAEAVKPGRFGGSLDDVGWSIQSDSIDLGAGTVTITSGGEDRPVVVTELPGGYGSRYALNIQPDGWTTTAGQTYAVSVSGTSTSISYEVEVVDCSE